MVTADYEYAPKMHKTSFKVPVKLNLEMLKKHLEEQSMEVKRKGNYLFAQNKEIYIHISSQGKIRIISFSNNSARIYCEMLLEYVSREAAA